ncbi:GntR family transcriptional regulator [Rhodococcus zopfii]|uniref:GntR family transcriptional regulator n=1 Tax=Rhodococcus zopfii TaxID=43772 RepID=A0ABU3WY75_9NOCA|nr:GntR family transcriptional regulator [Rhodococcus zopfii]MDV2478489.1 GntR family transcriptional regulator [Rhodococcus zopfii]
MSKLHSAAEQVYREVKERILSAALPGGELISEGEIAAEMGTSRTPVREAFLRLETEGWMRLYPKRGALVVPVADGEAEHVVAARLLLEADAVRVVTRGPGRAELVRALRANLEAQHEAADSGDVAVFSGLDADFHGLIVRAAGNPLLVDFYVGLRERQRRMTARSLVRDPLQLNSIIDDHTRLVDLVDAGDADGFATADDVHMRRVHGLPRTTGEDAR